MLLSGHNFLTESKVMFVEKAQGKPKLVFSHSAFLISFPFASSLALVFFITIPSPCLSPSAHSVCPSVKIERGLPGGPCGVH